MKIKYICILIALVICFLTIDVKAGCGTKSGAPSWCNSAVNCSNYNETNCKSNSSCCVWTAPATATPVPAAKVSSVTGGGRTAYLAADETASFSFTASSDPIGANNFNPSWSVGPSSGASGSGSGSNYTLVASGASKGSGSSCAKTTYTVTATSGGVSKSATASVCKYCSSWKGPFKTRIISKEKRNTSKPSVGCYYYEGEEKVDGGWLYTAYYTRCCGGGPTSDAGACYGDKKYLGIAQNVLWQTKATSDRPYKYTGVSEQDCHAINVNICNANPTTPSAIKVNTDSCEDTKEIHYKDITACSNYEESTEKNFYTIECERTINTSFDYGDDNSTTTNRVLYKGGGFGFGIKITSTHTCTARFNKTTWEELYNRYLKKIGFVSSSLVNYVKNYDHNGWAREVNKLDASKDVKSEVYELWNILEGLSDLVEKNYVGFKPENKYDEQASIELTYNVAGKSTKVTDQLIISDKDSTEGAYTKTNSSTKYNLTSKLKNVPEYFVMTNEKNPRVIKLMPKRSYIEKYIGKGVNDDESNIDGGNKIYVDYDIDATGNKLTYPISIEVKGLGSNGSEVINNKCDYKVVDDEIYYRPIDVTNPFINDNWEIGKNWLNNKFSFTNTIKSNVWSLSSLLKINLSKSNIDDIKASNNTFRDKYPYLGLCDRINTASQDGITTNICNELKRAIDNFQ